MVIINGEKSDWEDSQVEDPRFSSVTFSIKNYLGTRAAIFCCADSELILTFISMRKFQVPRTLEQVSREWNAGVRIRKA